MTLSLSACAFDGVHYDRSYHYGVEGTIYDDRYRDYYGSPHQYNRHHYRNRHRGYKHCRIITREDYDTDLNRHVWRKYRVCR